MSKFWKFKYFIFVQPLNILRIDTTLVVTKLDTSIDVNSPQAEKNPSIDVTLMVLNLDVSILVNFLQFEKIFFMLVTFEVSNDERSIDKSSGLSENIFSMSKTLFVLKLFKFKYCKFAQFENIFAIFWT